MKRKKHKPLDKTLNSFEVFEWHLFAKGSIGKEMTVEQILDLDYKHISFDRVNGRAIVCNCCHFKTH